MSKSQLPVEKRNNDLNPRQLRSSGKVPATIYGKGIDPVSVELDTKNFMHTYKKDKTAVFELKVEGKTYSTIVKKVQYKAINDNVLNIEFQNIREDEAVKVKVPVTTTGKSPAVAAGGNLSVNYNEMEVECLPANIPSSLVIDISVLEKFEDSITVAKVNYPEGVKPTVDADSIVVKVNTPKEAKGKGPAEEEETEATTEEA